VKRMCRHHPSRPKSGLVFTDSHAFPHPQPARSPPTARLVPPPSLEAAAP
jgi:hypothetical protein